MIPARNMSPEKKKKLEDEDSTVDANQVEYILDWNSLKAFPWYLFNFIKNKGIYFYYLEVFII
jgi:hypothetical protein